MHYDHQVHTLYYHHIYILVFFHVFVYVFVYSLLLRCMFKVKLLACGSEDVTQYNTVYLFMRRFSIKLSFFFSLEKQRRVISARWGVVFIFINNSIKLKYKVTLWVHKPRKKSYISSVVFVINLNWKKAGYFIYFSKTGEFHPVCVFVWQKRSVSYPGYEINYNFHMVVLSALFLRNWNFLELFTYDYFIFLSATSYSSKNA